MMEVVVEKLEIELVEKPERWWIEDWRRLSVEGEKGIYTKGWGAEVGSYLVTLWHTSSEI